MVTTACAADVGTGPSPAAIAAANARSWPTYVEFAAALLVGHHGPVPGRHQPPLMREDEVLQSDLPVPADRVHIGPELAVPGERGLEPARRPAGEREPDGRRAVRHRLRAPAGGRRARVGERPGHRRLTLPSAGPSAGLSAGAEQSQAVDRVAAAVHQRAAAQVEVVPDVVRVGDGEARPALKMLHRSQLGDEFAQPPRQWVVAIVHGLHHDQAAGRGGVRHLRRLVRVGRERLLAQHVLPGGDRLQRPRPVLRVRQRVVDGVDVRVGQQFLVGPVGRGYPVPQCEGVRAGLVPGRHRSHRHLGHARGRLDQGGQGYARRTKGSYT